MSLLWINGILTDKADAKVSPFDHGFLYGDGVWEHLRVFGGNLFRPGDHLDLLFAAAGTLGIDIPLSREELTAAIDATVKANDRTEGYVRVIVTRGPGTIGPDPRKLDPQVLIIAEEYRPFPDELYGHGLHATVTAFPLDPDYPSARIRTLGSSHVASAKTAALRAGCLEAILTHAELGVVGGTEGTLFWAETTGSGERVRCIDDIAIPDVAAVAAAGLVQEAGYPVDHAHLDAGDLAAGNELFLAGTACGVIGIVRVDGQDIGSGTEGPITRAVRERYHALTRGE